MSEQNLSENYDFELGIFENHVVKENKGTGPLEISAGYQGNDIINGNFFAPVTSDFLDGLIGRYRMMRNNIEQVSAFIIGDHNMPAINYFLRGNKDRHSYYTRPVLEVFDLSGAVACLNADYWQEALKLTDVFDYMPNERREEWNAQIRNMSTPDFEENTVRPTLIDLLNSRQQFFSERIDGIFRALSGDEMD